MNPQFEEILKYVIMLSGSIFLTTATIQHALKGEVWWVMVLSPIATFFVIAVVLQILGDAGWLK